MIRIDSNRNETFSKDAKNESLYQNETKKVRNEAKFVLDTEYPI